MAFLNGDPQRIARSGRRGLYSAFTIGILAISSWIQSTHGIGTGGNGMSLLNIGLTIGFAVLASAEFLVAIWAFATLRKIRQTGDAATQEALRQAELSPKQLRKQRNQLIGVAVIVLAVVGWFYYRMQQVNASVWAGNERQGAVEVLLLLIVAAIMMVAAGIMSELLRRRREVQ